jgi:oxygen-independent coproporphyrinogen-3 oxidase
MVSQYSSVSFGVYVHIPFCERKCPYCDFNSFATTTSEVLDKEKLYIDSVCKEIDFKSTQFNLNNRICSGIFFGGGTPTLLSSDGLLRILSKLKEVFVFNESIEITLEANPKSVVECLSKDKLKNIFDGGFNRISIGAQSFNEEKLKFLGRWHSPSDIINTVEIARTSGFRNINLDLIFGIKDESITSWEKDLSKVIELSPDHISTYMLTLEPGTDFGRRSKKGEILNVADNLYVDMYELAQEKLAKNSYYQYEVSNFSKNNFKCRHNLIYWKGGEYLGLGAGAHGFLKSEKEVGLRYSNTPSPEVYSNRIKNEEETFQRKDKVSRKELFLEYFSLGLRLVEGLSNSDIANDFFNEFQGYVNCGKLNNLIKIGLLEISDENVKIPQSKFNLADGIISEIYSSLS